MNRIIYPQGTVINLFETRELSVTKAIIPISFTILECIGQGSSCVAYNALRYDNIKVRLKHFSPLYHSENAVRYEHAKEHFLKSYQVQQQLLSDDNTVNSTSSAFGLYYSIEQTPWTAVQYVAGSTMKSAEFTTLNSLLHTLRYVTEAVNAYHQSGWLLLDLKPQNIFTIKRGSGLNGVNLFDFDSLLSLKELQDAKKSDTSLVISTSIGWCAPELRCLDLESIGFQTDYYSLGAIMFYYLFNRLPEPADCRPFRDFNFNQTNEVFKPELLSLIRKKLAQFLHATLCSSVSGRYGNGQELIRALYELSNLTDPKEMRLTCFTPGTVENFVGRTSEKQQLLKLLHNGKNPVFIWGTGGMGKTEFVRCFAAEKHLEFDFYYTTFNGSIEDTLCQLSIANLPEKQIDEKGKEIRITAKERYLLVLNCLKQYDNGSILIIDNFDSENRHKLRHEKAYDDLLSLSMKIIFTTRCQFDNVAKVCIDKLSNIELLTLMRKYISNKTETDNILMSLIKETHSHTMIVDIIARTIKESRGTLTAQNVLESLQQNNYDNSMFEKVESNYNKDDYTPRRVLGHLHTIFKLANLDSIAKNILCCTCLLPPEGIESTLLKKILPENHWETTKTLEWSGWLHYKNNIWTLHPLIKIVIESTPEVCPSWNKIREFTERLEQTATSSIFQTYNSNLILQMAFLYVNAAQVKDIPRQKAAEFYNNASFELTTAGKHKAALKYIKNALDIFKTIKPSDQNKISTVYDNMGCIFDELAEHQKALEYKQKALTIRKSLFPPDPLAIAASYNNIGASLCYLGNFQNALDYTYKALSIRKEVLPPNHLDLALSYNNISNICGNMGDQNKALLYNLIALTIKETLLPLDHPELAKTYNNVATIFSNLGKYQQASEYMLDALAINKKILPSEHLELAYNNNNLGLIFNNLGENEKALEYLRKALSILEGTLAPNRPELAECNNNVGVAYIQLGEYQNALQYFHKALTIHEMSSAQITPAIAKQYNNVGASYSQLRNYQKALENLLKALQIYEKVCPLSQLEQLDQALCYFNIGCVFGKLGKQEESLANYLKALSIREKHLSTNHPDLALTYNNIGCTYSELNNHQKALEYQLRSLVIFKTIKPTNSPDLALIYYNVACSYSASGDQRNALTNLLNTLKVRENILSKNNSEVHPDLAHLFSNIGAIYCDLGEQQKALEFEFKTLAILKQICTVDDPELAICYSKIAYYYRKLKQYRQALIYKRKARHHKRIKLIDEL